MGTVLSIGNQANLLQLGVDTHLFHVGRERLAAPRAVLSVRGVVASDVCLAGQFLP
ncbi:MULTISPECIES: hypothetical protein [unclassified Cryobacterium]|uniref:hypothetical protein n=1 Tax=unclassified Cryobacterium TaxID=2649013 RepID=UPI002B235C6A|nr:MULTISPECIES: hypothetical protein [unclassified Cryobacterium]MEB0276650.1 hypothetical protein [Cryobacterium sp. 5B3]